MARSGPDWRWPDVLEQLSNDVWMNSSTWFESGAPLTSCHDAIEKMRRATAALKASGAAFACNWMSRQSLTTNANHRGRQKRE